MPKLSSGFAAPLITPNPFPNFVPQQGGPYVNAGSPSSGTACVQTLTIGGTPSGGTFTLTFSGQTTGSIAWTATDATLESNIAAGLNALTNIGANGVAVTAGTGSSGIGTYLITFQNQNADLAVPAILVGVNSMTGTSPTVSVATTTTGVNATLRGAYAGTLIADYTKPALWCNTGSPNNVNYVRTDCFCEVLTISGVASTSGGGQGTWQPAEGGPVIIRQAILYVTTASTGAANYTIGQGSSATTSYSNLITASSIHTANVIFDSVTLQIAASAAVVLLMPAANFVTVTASATAVGAVTQLFIWYFKP